MPGFIICKPGISSPSLCRIMSGGVFMSDKGLLYFMNGNLQMAKLSTTHMIEKCPDEKMRAALLEDLHTLEKFESALLNIKGEEKIKPLTDMAQMNTEFAIDMKLWNDKSNDKMAKMLATGYEKGIASITENIQRAQGEDKGSLELAKSYLHFLKECHAKYNAIREI